MQKPGIKPRSEDERIIQTKNRKLTIYCLYILKSNILIKEIYVQINVYYSKLQEKYLLCCTLVIILMDRTEFLLYPLSLEKCKSFISIFFLGRGFFCLWFVLVLKSTGEICQNKRNEITPQWWSHNL